MQPIIRVENLGDQHGRSVGERLLHPATEAVHVPDGHWVRSMSPRICAITLVISGIVMWLLSPSQGYLLGCDEVDYVNAAKLGATSNMIERDSMGLMDLINFARSKYERHRPTLPGGYDESRDTLLLRHYHPPLVVLMLSGLSTSRDERILRSVQLVGAFVLIGVILTSYFSLTTEVSWPGIVTVSLLAFWMSVMLFGSLSFHGWSAVWTTLSAALLSHWLNGRGNPTGLALCVSLALALLTLETGLIVLAAALLCLAIWSSPAAHEERCRFSWRSLAYGSLMITLIVVVIWPGALFKASFLKIPALYLYRIWLGNEYASVIPNMSGHVRSLLPEITLGVAAFLWLPVAARATAKRWGPLMIVGGLYTGALARFALSPTYLIAGFGPIACAVGMAVDLNKSTARRIFVVSAALLTIGATWPIGSMAVADYAARDDLQYLRDALRGRKALMDGGHIYQYYLGPGYSIQSIHVSYDENILMVRERGSYRALGPEDVKGKMIVIQKSRRNFLSGTAARTLLGRWPAGERRTIIVYDCIEAASNHNIITLNASSE